MFKLIVILTLQGLIQIETYEHPTLEGCEQGAALHNSSSTTKAPVIAYCVPIREWRSIRYGN